MPTGSTWGARCRPASTTSRSPTSPQSTCCGGRRRRRCTARTRRTASFWSRRGGARRGRPASVAPSPKASSPRPVAFPTICSRGPPAAVPLATGYPSGDVRMPINDNNILGVLPSGFLGVGDSTINDGWGFFPPGDVFQVRTSQAVERLTGSVRGSWRPLSFLEASLVLGMDRVRQSDRQLQARGEGPNILGLRLGRVLAGRSRSDHYSVELGARAAFHVSAALATRTVAAMQYFNATGDTLLRLGRGLGPGDTSLAGAAVQTVLADAQGSDRLTGLFLEEELSLRDRLFMTDSLRHDTRLLGDAGLAGRTQPALCL